MVNLRLLSLIILIWPALAASPEAAEAYRERCAVCHGTDGRGRGPAAAALKHAPTDLTTLARRNGGKFPVSVVAAKISDPADTEMPEWGKMLPAGKVSAIVGYLEGIQAK